MSKDPAVLFYYSDFLTGTVFMTDEEVGQYIKLLCHQADKGRLTEKQVLSICKAHAIPYAIREKLILDENGLYYQKRMEEEKLKRSNYVESRRKSALSGKSVRTAYAERMEDVNVNTNEDLNVIVLNEDRFFEFWDMYDKKVRKPAAQKQWAKLTEAEKQKVLAITPAYVRSKPEKQYRLDPERFLKYKSFNDEIIEATNGTDRKNGGARPDQLAAIVARRFERQQKGN